MVEDGAIPEETEDVVRVWDPSSDLNRKRGILTQKDRQYLVGEIELQGQDKRNLLYRMRQRVRNSVLDMMLLGRHYPDDEIRKVSKQIAGEYEEAHPPFIPTFGMVEWVYAWAKASDMVTQEGFRADTAEQYLEDTLSSVIKRWHRDNEGEILKMIDVKIDIEYSDLDLSELENKVYGGHATYGEFERFVRESNEEKVLDLINYLQDVGAVSVQLDQNTERGMQAADVLSLLDDPFSVGSSESED